VARPTSRLKCAEGLRLRVRVSFVRVGQRAAQQHDLAAAAASASGGLRRLKLRSVGLQN